jgi:hypothetical protein
MRVFDVGDEIALDGAQRVLADAGSRAKLPGNAAHAFVVASPPIDVPLGTRRTKVLKDSPERDVTMSARLYDYGAISISVEIELAPGTDLASLLPTCAEIYESPLVDDAARTEVESILARLADSGCVQGARVWRGSETFTIIFLEKLDGDPHVAEVLAWPQLANLLSGEPTSKPLSDEQRQDILKHAHSYFRDDLVIVDWNSAFVLEPTGTRVVADILDFATSQLLELRYYDGILDRELARIYDDLAAVRRRSPVFASSYRKLAHALLRRLLELMEFTERVDNALKIIGDFYLARVYGSAVQRFRIRDWQASTDAKQALLSQAHGLIRSEIEARRSTILELVVILLIVIEVVLALIRH